MPAKWAREFIGCATGGHKNICVWRQYPSSGVRRIWPDTYVPTWCSSYFIHRVFPNEMHCFGSMFLRLITDFLFPIETRLMNLLCCTWSLMYLRGPHADFENCGRRPRGSELWLRIAYRCFQTDFCLYEFRSENMLDRRASFINNERTCWDYSQYSLDHKSRMVSDKGFLNYNK